MMTTLKMFCTFARITGRVFKRAVHWEISEFVQHNGRGKKTAKCPCATSMKAMGNF